MTMELLPQAIKDVSATSFLTLYCHALESQSAQPILHDPWAVEITKQLTPQLQSSDNPLYQKLVQGKLDREIVVYVNLRARKYDQYAQDFLQRKPEGIIVNLGCGLDPRFQRIDDGKLSFYDLDFPEVIAFKKQCFSANERYKFIPSNLLNYQWMEQLLSLGDKQFLFLIEGVLMYLHETEVKSLILTLQSKFPGCELVAEVCNSFWLRQPFRSLMNLRLRRKLGFGSEATFNFGISDSKALESWHQNIYFLDDWSFVDETKAQFGRLKLLKNFDLVRKSLWTVHYSLS